DRAALRRDHAVDAIEQRALARAVRADDGAHLVLAHVEGDVFQRGEAAEGQAHARHGEDDVAELPRARAWRRGPLRRAGRGRVQAGLQGRAMAQRRGDRRHAASLTTGRATASCSARSAATTPVRPSSKRTTVSMNWCVKPAYNASTSAAYFWAIRRR